MSLFNLARMTVSSSGTGDITLASAVSGFLTFDLAGCSTAAVGQVVTYAISDTNQSEIGSATYYSTSLAVKNRSPTNSTNANAVINMSNAAQVFITPQATDFTTQISIGSPDSNLMLNGAMEVAQEKGTATTTMTVSPFNSYVLDMIKPAVTQGTMRLAWTKSAAAGLPYFPICLQSQASTGFNGAFGVNDFVMPFVAPLEGTRLSVFGWGAAGAATMYVGFWAYSTLAGTIAVVVQNAAQNRSYIRDVTISAPTTWQWCTTTIPGDTAGTWPATTSQWGSVAICSKGGANIQGVVSTWTASNVSFTAATTNFYASNGNIVNVTGLVVSTVALPASGSSRLLFRPFDEELGLCQRYYEKTYPYASAPGATVSVGDGHLLAMDGLAVATHSPLTSHHWRVYKRATPSLTFYSPNTGTSGVAQDAANSTDRPITFSGVSETECHYAAATGVANSVLDERAHIIADARL